MLLDKYPEACSLPPFISIDHRLIICRKSFQTRSERKQSKTINHTYQMHLTPVFFMDDKIDIIDIIDR